MRVATIILAAGQGTRMKSDLPKVLHPLNGKALVEYSIQAAAGLDSERTIVVIGNGSELVQQVVGSRAQFALQQERLGTAHAVLAAESTLKGFAGLVVVISADMPLLTTKTLKTLVEQQAANQRPLTLLTVRSKNPRGFGRILRGETGDVVGIIEEAQASPEQMKIDELNVGAYCFDAAWLWPSLKQIELSPTGEYYLTDIVAVAVKEGRQSRR